MKLRNAFLAPTAVLMVDHACSPRWPSSSSTASSPAAHMAASSCPGPSKTYTRLWDPLYGAIFYALDLDRRRRPRRCACCWVPAGAVHRAIGSAQESVPEPGDPAVLDQLPDPHLRLDVPAARHRPHQHGSAGAANLIREPLPLLYNDGAVILGLVYGFLPFMVLPLYATLERLDPKPARSRGRSGRATLATR